MILETDKEELWRYIRRRLLGMKSTGEVPSAHVDVNTPFSTTSATLVDITGAVVTLANTIPCKFQVIFTADFNATGAGSAITLAYAISVDGVDEDEQHIDFSHSDADETGALAHITAALTVGVHTIKARMRRAAGTQTAQFTSGMLSAVAMQANVQFIG